MGRLFGTDGVRGIANKDLTAAQAMEIGRAAGIVLQETSGKQPTFLVGKDTRLSGDMLESALAAGLCSVGAHVILLGVVPTPAVAYLVTKYGADAGVMLSASHNPHEYNGIKIFNNRGYKLSDSSEEEIEEIVLDHTHAHVYAEPGALGCVSRAEHAVEDYIEHLTSTIDQDLSGLRVAIDCANGSASVTAHKLFARLGVRHDIFFADPDGTNINDGCGSTHMDRLAEIVKAGGYDLGLAFDGDADRCLAVDETGALIDGDRMLAIFAYHLKEQGKLLQNTLVVTVMSNLGLFKFAEEHGIETRSTKVGDRYVLECMLEEGFCIGGEQSGHLIFLDHMTTGDGQLSGVQLLALAAERGCKLSELVQIMQVYPQTLVNVQANPQMKLALANSQTIAAEIARCEQELGGNGRVLVRASGTEPLIRVMVEGSKADQIERIAGQIARTIEAAGTPC